jgi:hypothetical protein
MSQTLQTAVLFLIYKRPEPTRRVFEAIRQARPPRLYLASDLPPPDRPGEIANAKALRTYVLEQVDWPCEVQTLFRETHLGCGAAVSGALDWFFEHEQEGIILEDDCLPDATFFPFAAELLYRYRDDERVMNIAGNHFNWRDRSCPHSYFFSRSHFSWGWASWRRAWKLYDRNLGLWPQLRDTDWLLTLGEGERAFQRYWTHKFDELHAGQIDTWDYQWTFACWAQSGLTIVPSRNLVKHLGFGLDATHTRRRRLHLERMHLETMEWPLVHPPHMVRDCAADRWMDRTEQRIRWRDAVVFQIANGWRNFRARWFEGQA